MRRFTTAISALGLAAILAPAPALAQSFDLRPELTKDEFKALTAELGAVLRSHPLGDATTLGKGNVDLSVEFGATAIDDSKAWSNVLSHATAGRDLSQSLSFPRIGARFGVSDRVDVGLIGGFGPRGKYGLAGADMRIALVTQGPSSPVSVSVRPSMTFLIAPSEVLIGNVGADVAISRAFGPVSPYAGVAASTSGAVERSKNIDLNPVSAGDSLAYAGLSYHWRRVIVSAEVEKGDRASYAVRIGTRF